MENWNETQQQFVDSLGETDKVFSEVLSKDPDGLVIGGEDRRRLEDLAARNSKILKKLRDKEFTVAVVGLEKAGKSTLGNALLKLEVLPEYSERCTYTTTEIRNGSEDSGEIFFYSYDEFNRDFKQMLTKLKYDGSADFSSLDISTFNRFWESMAEKEPELYRVHDGTTAEDIRAILQGRNVIKSLLGQSPQKFIGAEELKSQRFQIYITGIQGYKENSDGSRVVDRSPHPYAVKKVNILSTNLRDMKHIVLYDVPGFDSPTELHKKQTKEMLQEADAIILVTNVGDRPNLTGTQLNMLQTSYDADGISLSEKAFVFGNKIDMAASEQTAKNNIAALRSDAVNKYKIASDRHIFCGSAKAYLDEAVGKSSGKIGERLAEWNMQNGIEALRKSMEDYYNNERFDVLRKRAEKTLHDAGDFLHEVLEHTETALSQPVDGSEYVIQIKNALSTFVKEAKIIEDEYLIDIDKNTPFSKLIIDNIDEIYSDISESDEIVISAERERVSTTGRVYPTGSIDSAIRENLRRLFIKEIVSRTSNATQEKEQEIYATLSKKLLEILDVSTSSQYYEELDKSVNAVFDDIRISNDGEKCRFNTLVKRFTTGLIESIIQHPFADDARLRRVRDESLTEFFSLAAYYTAQDSGFAQDIDLSDDSERLQLFAKIMTHGKVSELDNNEKSENHKSMTAFFAEKYEDDKAVKVEQWPVGKWAKMLDKVGLNFEDKTNKVKRSVDGVFWSNNWDKLIVEEKIKEIDSIIAKACQNAETVNHDANSGSLKAIINALHEDAVEEKQTVEAKIGSESESLESQNAALKAMMVESINTDIANLRDITVKAVVKAINLEHAFSSVIIDNVEFIRKDAEDTSNQSKFDAWINQNKRKIRNNEYAQIEREQTDNITRRNIIENINGALSKLKI